MAVATHGCVRAKKQQAIEHASARRAAARIQISAGLMIMASVFVAAETLILIQQIASRASFGSRPVHRDSHV
jgi:hypothetical protein